jgi:hypothetical protein
MSTDTPPVWPSPEASATPVAPPTVTPPQRSSRPAVAGALVAVALVGALVGVAGDRLVAGTFGSAATLPGPLLSSLPHATPAPAQDAAPAAAAPAAQTPASPRTAPANPSTGQANPGTGQANPSTAPRGSRRANPGSPPNANPTTPPSTTTGASTDPAQQAVQQIIQKGDDEQAQAVANKDLTVMADSATTDFYQQQQQITQDLIDNGVTAIKLAKIEWGPITVNGGSASATAYETWTTNFSDGTTDQSRDRNVYTLVQQDGTWKIQSDEHPDQTQTIPGFPGTGIAPPGIGIPSLPSPRQQP